MQQEEPKLPITMWEIILLVIVTPVVWYATTGLFVFFLLQPIGHTYIGYDTFIDAYGYRTIPTLLAVALVLAFDVGWIIVVVKKKTWLVENKRAKVYLTVLVLTLSAAFLTAIYMLGSLQAAFA
ncbi:MAG: hypothetical protein ACYTEL_11830 [Planctomycetota bacterium]|jgi:hypothetical protein